MGNIRKLIGRTSLTSVIFNIFGNGSHKLPMRRYLFKIFMQCLLLSRFYMHVPSHDDGLSTHFFTNQCDKLQPIQSLKFVPQRMLILTKKQSNLRNILAKDKRYFINFIHSIGLRATSQNCIYFETKGVMLVLIQNSKRMLRRLHGELNLDKIKN